MPTEPLSPAERAALREQHQPHGDSADAYCPICRTDWPCPTVRLLDALDAAETDLLESTETWQQETCYDTSGVECRFCGVEQTNSRKERHDPDCLRLRVQAALGPAQDGAER